MWSRELLRSKQLPKTNNPLVVLSGLAVPIRQWKMIGKRHIVIDGPNSVLGVGFSAGKHQLEVIKSTT